MKLFYRPRVGAHAGSQPAGDASAAGGPVDSAAARAPGTDRLRHAARVGERWLFLPDGVPAELVSGLRRTRLPFAPPWCLGLANFRGDPVPLYDLAALLIGPDAGHRGRRADAPFLVIGPAEARAGIGVDEVRTLSVPAGLDPRPIGSPPGFERTAEGEPLSWRAATIAGTTYVETDLTALLAALAQRAGEGPQAAERARAH